MYNVWTVVKKELRRVFTDYRVILSLFVLPPVTIILIYGLIGLSAKNQTTKIEEYVPKIIVVNPPEQITEEHDDFTTFLTKIEAKGNFTTYKNSTESEIENYRNSVLSEEYDLLIVFPENFVSLVKDYQLPEIETYFNINKSYSRNAYTDFINYLSLYEKDLLTTRIEPEKLIVFKNIPGPLGDVQKAKGSAIGMILPLLVIIYLMAGAMGVGIESVAGEKERGTIATLLITPIKRSQLAIGKIFSTSILGLLSSLASFVGILAILPTFATMSGDTGESTAGLLGGYNISHALMILVIMAVAVLFFVTIVIITSTYAKTIKEASTLIMPIYLVVMGAAMFTMFTEEVSLELTSYMIPVYNIIISLKAILSFDMTTTNFIVTTISTIGYTIILIYIIQKMFKSEKVMFNR